MADKESYILLWDMLIQFLRQKGQMKGRYLAELLSKDRKEGVVVESRSRAREMEGPSALPVASATRRWR